MGGGPTGQVGTGTVEIRVLDINDNHPTLEKSEVRNLASKSSGRSIRKWDGERDTLAHVR